MRDRGFRGGDPLISVIIPTHDRAELLCTRALPSVLAQTYSNIDVIVALHGYPQPQLRAVWHWWAALDEDDLARVHLVSVPRTERYPPTAENHWLAGPVEPLNAILCSPWHIYGAWLARIDDDDIWTPDHLEKLLRFAQEGDYEFVSAAHRTHEGKVEPYIVRGNKIGGTQTWLYRSYLRFFRYNRDCWRKEWNRVNDVDLQDRMASAGVRMGYLDEVVAEVFPRPGETHIGSKAYTTDPERAERQFAFN